MKKAGATKRKLCSAAICIEDGGNNRDCICVDVSDDITRLRECYKTPIPLHVEHLAARTNIRGVGVTGNIDRASRCPPSRKLLRSRVNESSFNVPAQTGLQSARHKEKVTFRRAYRASVKNASSTPSFIFALVSMNLIPSSSANSRP